MAEPFTPRPPYAPPPAPFAADNGSLTAAIVIYALYLVALFTGGLSMVLGVVIAYALRGRAGEAARSHYTFQIRTFWGGAVLIGAGVLMVLVGLPLTLVGVGFLLIWAGVGVASLAHLWQLVRCAVGLFQAANGRPCPDPRTPLI